MIEDEYFFKNNALMQQLMTLVKEHQMIVVTGLPGVGKSLYLNILNALAQSQGKEVEVIQWDVARKAFETDYIQSIFPMGTATVHNGLKLVAGKWLIEVLVERLQNNQSDRKLLLVEAPLIGHRFVELVHRNTNSELETYLSSEKVKFVVPVPSRKLRKHIEIERSQQVSENAKVWSGAKPSVVLALWNHLCEIAVELQCHDNIENRQYDPELYACVYSEILKHRNFEILNIDDVFEIEQKDESHFHFDDSLKAEIKQANKLAKEINDRYSENEINSIVEQWYCT